MDAEDDDLAVKRANYDRGYVDGELGRPSAENDEDYLKGYVDGRIKRIQQDDD